MAAPPMTPSDSVSVSQHCRRDALMLTTVTDERASARSFVYASFVLNLKDGDPRPHVGLIRDVSDSGMFFYSDLKPACGSELDFHFKLPRPGTEAQWIACRGRVVRVEHPAPGAAVGVALQVEHRQVLAS